MQSQELFLKTLKEIDTFKKHKQFDAAWRLANTRIIELADLELNKERKSNEIASWYMLYYQLADISSREKKWRNVLSNMGILIFYGGRVGGVGHEKLIKRALTNYDKQDRYDAFVKMSLDTQPKLQGAYINSLIESTK